MFPLWSEWGPGLASQHAYQGVFACCPCLSGGISHPSDWAWVVLCCSGCLHSCPPAFPSLCRGTAVSLTSRPCECTLPCNPIGRVHCACYRLGPMYSQGLCFRFRRLIRRDTVQRESSIVREPVLLCFTEDTAFSSLLLVWKTHRAALSHHSSLYSHCLCYASPVRHPGVMSWQHRTKRLQHPHIYFPTSSLPSSASFAVLIPASVIQETVASDGELYSQGEKELSPKKRSEREKNQKTLFKLKSGSRDLPRGRMDVPPADSERQGGLGDSLSNRN